MFNLKLLQYILKLYSIAETDTTDFLIPTYTNKYVGDDITSLKWGEDFIRNNYPKFDRKMIDKYSTCTCECTKITYFNK